MIDLNYKEITKIIKLLEDKVLELSRVGSYDDELSPIMQLQNHINNYDVGERFEGDEIKTEDLSEEARELLTVQRIIDKFESEINKVTFSFSLRGKTVNSISDEDTTS